MADFKANVFICAWYKGGIRDFHLAFMKENGSEGAVSILRITDGRDPAGVISENAKFGASKTYVFDSTRPLMRLLTKLLPIFSIYALFIAWRAKAQGIFISHDGFCFWSIPSFLLRRKAYVFAHDPAPHETAEAPRRAWARRSYFRFVYYRKRWKAVVVGSESNRRTMLERGCASPVISVPFPEFGAELFDLTPVEPTPEIEGVTGYILFFGRIDVYKGVYDWLQENADRVGVPIVIAGRVLDKRVFEFEDRAIFIDRFIGNGEIGALFRNACALICPYSSATHSGIPDLGLSYGVPVYVSRIPYFEERYGAVEGVKYMDELPADLAAREAAPQA